MRNYLGLIIGIDTYHDKQINPVRFASNDALEINNSFIKLGCDPEKFELITNEKATKSTIEHKVREVSELASDNNVIIFFFAGHGCMFNDINKLFCVDTIHNAIGNTTIDLNFILSTFENSHSRKVVAFLDCCHSRIKFNLTERSQHNIFSSESLRYYDKAEHLTVFTSCKSNEKSQTDLERKHGAWSYYLIEALNGNADELIYEGNILFSDALQKYLSKHVPKRVKEISGERRSQTPLKFGKETVDKFIIAEMSDLFQTRNKLLQDESVKFNRIIISTSEEGWVRDLPGFNKDAGHKVPKVIDSYGEKWIKKIGEPLIQEGLNEIASKLREQLGYKRENIRRIIIQNGTGQLPTSDFDYIISISQSKENSEKYTLTNSIENFKNSNILSSSDFNKTFNGKFKTFEYLFEDSINISLVIDRIETKNSKDIDVEVNNLDENQCFIQLSEFDGYIDLTDLSMKIVYPMKASPISLINLSKDLQIRLSEII